MTDRLVTLRDGRRLGLTAMGDPAVQRMVVVCHPAPGASGFDPDPPVTDAWGVHLVSLDRPGYAASTPYPDAHTPSLAGAADDVAEYAAGVVQLARESGSTPLNRLGVIGWGIGGLVALALAARHPGLVDRVSVVAAPAPQAEVPWLPEPLAALLPELRGRPSVEARRLLVAAIDGRPGGAGRPGLLVHGDADEALLGRTGLRGRLERMLGQAAAQGSVGYADDLLAAAVQPWGFDLDEVRTPVQLVYGAKDPLTSSAHGRWYRRHLRHASAHLTVVPRAGHMVIAPAWRTILEHVDPQHGARSDV